MGLHMCCELYIIAFTRLCVTYLPPQENITMQSMLLVIYSTTTTIYIYIHIEVCSLYNGLFFYKKGKFSLNEGKTASTIHIIEKQAIIRQISNQIRIRKNYHEPYRVIQCIPLYLLNQAAIDG